MCIVLHTVQELCIPLHIEVIYTAPHIPPNAGPTPTATQRIASSMSSAASSDTAQSVTKPGPRISFAPDPAEVGTNAHARTYSRTEYLERELAPYKLPSSRRSAKVAVADASQAASVRTAMEWMTRALGRRDGAH